MSRLTDLIRRAKERDPALGADLEAEFRVLSDRRVFGLNFERHRPEAVELPQRPARRGDKVRVLPPRGTAERGDQRLWRVTAVETVDGARVAHLAMLGSTAVRTAPVEDLVVVAEFRDPVYPGLKSTGRVERGGDKPFHVVVNGENFHALQTLLYTHRGTVDAIYIDPPYNTGAKDWKYNNDYVDGEDLYRHSKWLAFLERRLLLAKQLLDPADSVLVVTIDEKEYLRLGLLLEQTFPEAGMQMVSSVINPAGAGRASEFARTDEYVFFLRFGAARVLPEKQDTARRGVTWDTLRRSDVSSRRGTAKGGRAQFYPFYVNESTGVIEEIGEPLPHDAPRTTAPSRAGCVAVFPIRPDGTEMNWGITPGPARERLAKGYLRVGRHTPNDPQQYAISYLTGGIIADIEAGRVTVSGRAPDGSVIAAYESGKTRMPTTNWNRPSHDAQRGGTAVLTSLLPDRRFPFPKSLYAVEDCLRFFLAEKPDAVVLDFFAGSGTTTHAVMRLNRQDGGRRRSICVTNNEVSAGEQGALLAAGLRPGDPEWERHGICDHITKPRIEAAVTGRAPDGAPVKGDYKFGDEFAMAEGLAENVEFFTLTYETLWRVARHRAFESIAPLLWLRAGAVGRRIDKLPGGWDVAETYAVLEDLDETSAFVSRVRETGSVRMAFVVTEDDRRFQMVCAELPDRVEPIRLYESYLRNFETATGRG